MDNYQFYYNECRKACVRIRLLCKQKHITFKHLADQLGLSVSTISRYIGAKVCAEDESSDSWEVPSFLFFVGAADVLGVKPEDLLGEPNRGELKTAMQHFTRRLKSGEGDPVREVKFLFQLLADSI